ncbi:hypothetical protein BKA65DRAFT_595617 [Rhexocercosporidium sp. MPI-PUGE-AT-0058]|nr:hypothetical protein BKA65DRAFT_595617 [Rhexocercosporidium sp. MPI-PUGE-AT-0058]
MASPSDSVAPVASLQHPTSISLSTSVALAASDLAGDTMDTNTVPPIAVLVPTYSFICSEKFTILMNATPASADTEESDSSEVLETSSQTSSNGQKLTSFTLFPKFPLEIRSLVWEAALPDGSRMPVTKYRTWGSGTTAELTELAEHVNNTCSIPITLYINQESRNETLRHYFVVPASLADPTIKVAPYVFSPARDTASMDFTAAINTPNTFNWNDNCWLSELDPEEVKKCIGQITWLWIDLDGSYQDPGHGFAPFVEHSDHEHLGRKAGDSWCCCFHFFSALKNVVFYIDHARDLGLVDIQDRVNFFGSVRDILASHATSFKSGQRLTIALSNRLVDGKLDIEGGFLDIGESDGEDSDDDGDDDDEGGDGVQNGGEENNGNRSWEEDREDEDSDECEDAEESDEYDHDE